MIRELIGREREQAELRRLLTEVMDGVGGIVLIAGEAGVGKTRLVEDSMAESGISVLRGAASEDATPPYAPVIAILRAHLRQDSEAFGDCGPIADYLNLLLPELGAAPPAGDQVALLESLRCAFQSIGRDQPAVILLDDLQWADNATLELLPELSEALANQPMLILGVYRSDEIPRGHPVRRLRNELRRARKLREITVEPLNLEATASLAGRIFGAPPSGQLASTLYDRTLGVPLFVEELAKALVDAGRLRQSANGFELTPGEQIPIPESVRDAVLLRLDRLPDLARAVLEVAAVAGFRFDLELVAELAGGESGLEPLIEYGLISEVEPGEAAFHHALTREAIYQEIMWTRRRSLHRQIAERLETEGAPPEVLAEHWLAGGERARARQALLDAVRSSCAVHAYRDALDAGVRALELWPENEQESQRLDVLDQLGQCAQLCGLPAEAARAWREVAEGRRGADDIHGWALAERRLATAYELQGAWERALAARQAAAEAFAACHSPGEAAAERFAQAAHLTSAGNYSAALELASEAVDESQQAGRQDLHARALGLKGNLLAKLGHYQTGRELVQSALSLALTDNLIGPAAEIYQRLASVLEQASDYPAARQAYETAINYCEQRGQATMGQVCLACLAVILRQTGEWKRAMSLCRKMIASDEASPLIRGIAACQLGMIHANRGEAKRARALLMEAAAQGRRNELVTIEIDSAWGLAIVDQLEEASEPASDHARFVLERWESTEDRHFAVPALRWGATFFAGKREETATNASAEALARIATDTGNPEALAALAHALGESAMLSGDAQAAVQQFRQALELLGELELPFEHAKSQVRAGVALAAAGERDEAVSHLANAYRTARNLGARPLAAHAAHELAELGEPVEQRMGRKVAAGLKHGGLTRRQLEVLRLVASGMTNKEVAQQLFLSPRTVDMHVGNILDRLNSRTRTDAVRKASELGLLN